MEIFESIPPHIMQFVIIPLLIMLARICDVTIGTIRIIFVSRGMRLLASVMGFIEVLIWIIVVSRIITDIGGWINYLAYAAGFAIGNFVGITLENRLAMGMVALRVITNKPADELIDHLKQEYHGVTSIAARGVSGDVRLVFAVIKRKDIPYFLKIVNSYNPKAYVSIEDVRTLSKTHQPPEAVNGKSFTHRMRSSLKRK
ncbi:MAG: DUF2179 domain-containing protein [Candidatus Marinimicrobia bacterium]|jgi:uncharacterized protein YebE (UPF0316 family)|nr:DUF2179 domain-containing protein [Candidatus Neomarinimicrobiota bacterium]MDD4961766.1 DUF2179 domain-containing protein [Candidatus Neomarinimicrobiota bacterium]MDD5709290.1 DUF2179 domain-containing protein [Candidatus Neomarinimicrobiota bacterium]MDX9777552.1 DUF2179 domain-containing protein [bacterium]